MCPSVRPSVQVPIALVSVDFVAPEVMGYKKREIPFWSILFRKKGLKSVDFVSREFFPARFSMNFIREKVLEKSFFKNVSVRTCVRARVRPSVRASVDTSDGF